MAQEEFKGKVKNVRDLALDLMRAREPGEGEGRGRAVFLIGAGCSVSAGIKSAPEVAKICATRLANTYSGSSIYEGDPLGAYNWLQLKEYMPASAELKLDDGTPDWGALYQYFFEYHIKTPIEQKLFINSIIADADQKLNWTHACLGELVSKRFVHTVLTTNFDQLVLQGIVRTGEIPVIADGLESLNRIDSRPKWPQVVHLHGSKHTYTLRNSLSSLDAVTDDPAMMGLISRLLQEANLLVVVGHSGNDKGLMAALKKASFERPDFLIYWVAFDRSHEKLSNAAKELLQGGNKFFIGAGPSDEFFAKLMQDLSLGGPQWVIDPVSAMKAESERLVVPASIDYVKSIIDGFRQRVSYADGHRYDDSENPKARAGVEAAKGDFSAAISILNGSDWRSDREAIKLYADFKLGLFKLEPSANRASLYEAITELSGLLKDAGDEERPRLIVALVRAKLNILDDDSDSSTVERELKSFLKELDDWSIEFADSDLECFANICAAQGQTLQELSEIDKNAETKEQNTDLLNQSVTRYKLAISAFKTLKQTGRTYLETKSGYAAAVQTLGLKEKDITRLQEAVKYFAEVKDAASTNTHSTEDAGLLMNLANAQKDLINITQELGDKSIDVALIISSAKENLSAAEEIYKREGDTSRLEDLRRIREEAEALK